MPAICESIPSSMGIKLSENISQSFKKSEKENFENLSSVPSIKQVLSTKIEYEEVPNFTNNTLTQLQTKYIVLKPNQQPLGTNVQFANSKNNQTNENVNEKTNHVNGSSTSISSSPSSNQLPKPKRTLFSRDLVQIGWDPALTRSWSCGSGFNNAGNTCYLNSTLQAFFHVPALAQWLLNDKEHRERCRENTMCIICAMASTLISTQRNNSSFTPSYITDRLSHICKHLILGRQEDAHEFLRYLVEKMEKSFLNRFRNEPWFKELDQYSKETTPLNQILGGYLRSTVTCLACNHDSITFQHFQDLPLDISRVNTLKEAIDGYFSRENLEECGYKCESCKKRVSAAKKFSLERAPTVLCIQLKRFTAMGGKLSKNIQIFEKLDLHRYLSKASDTSQNCSYRFVSMVTHLGGSANGGHYTAVGMGPKGNFYNFDDCRVSAMSTDSALKPNAYVLFYELEKPSKHCENYQNGHSIIFENGHSYSKNGVEMLLSPKSNIASRPEYDKMRDNSLSFSKPSLPCKFIPSNVMKNIKQKESSETTPTKSTVRPLILTNGNNSKLTTTPTSSTATILKLNGKREAENDTDDDEKQEIKRLKIKPTLPSLPRLSESEDLLKTPPKLNGSLQQQQTCNPTSPTTPTKPISLVPYETDDDDEEDSSNVAIKNGKEGSAKLLRTSSGVFVETDFKENSKGPSKQGSTIETKASVSLEFTNGKHHVNGNSCNNYVKRNDDAMQQLSKLNHSGYGTSNVMSWKNMPSNMNVEVNRDQNEERKRQFENDDDEEMDRGKPKKIKFNNIHSNHKQKLPNPFQEQQNSMNNHNGMQYERHNMHYKHNNGYNNRPYQNGGNNGFQKHKNNSYNNRGPWRDHHKFNNNYSRNNNYRYSHQSHHNHRR